MKNIFLMISPLILFLTECKTNKTNLFDTENKNIYVGNKKNNHLINLQKLNYINGKANYVFNGLYGELHKNYIDEEDYQEIYAITNIEREKLEYTGFAFCVEETQNIFYSFPLSPVFNGDYFNREIYDKMGGVLKIKIYVSVYKRDSISDLKTILIDSVKLR